MVWATRIVVSGMARHGGAPAAAPASRPSSFAGRRLRHAAGDRAGRAFAIGDRVFLPHTVKRHTVVEVLDLASGRHVASLSQPGLGAQPAVPLGAPVSLG